jgi:hypothetical protein
MVSQDSSDENLKDQPITSDDETSGMDTATKVGIGIIITVLVLCIGFMIWFIANRDTWESEHRYQIMHLCEEIYPLLQSKDPNAGVQKYNDLLRLIGNRNLVDLDMNKAVSDIKEIAEPVKRRIFAAYIASDKNSSTNPTPQSQIKPQTMGDSSGKYNPSSQTIDIEKELHKIVVDFEWQNVWKEGGKKLVVTIQNNSEYEFKGTIRVTGKSPRDETIDSDTILLGDGLAPDGSKCYNLLWFKNPEFISKLEYLIKGSFHVTSAEKPSVPYEEVGKVTGLNYTSFFIYTSASETDSLRKLGEYYKEKFKSLGGFKLLFFNDRMKTPTAFPMSDEELSAYFGSYEFFRLSGETEFIVNGKHIN